MPELDHDGVRRWDNHGAISTSAAPDDVEFLPAEAIFEAVGLVIGSERKDVQAALDRRDREIEGLRREIKMLRDEIGLERGLAALKTEVDQARQQARNHDDGRSRGVDGSRVNGLLLKERRSRLAASGRQAGA
jgi:hypothetical protein